MFDWDTEKLEIEKLNVVEMELEGFCAKSPSFYVSKGSGKLGKLSFDAAVEFCENIGGALSIPSLEGSVEPFLGTDPAWVGYTDRQQEGRWVSQLTGEKLGRELRWDKRQPANKTEDQDCAVVNADKKLEAVRCSQEALTLCRMERPVRFQLRGADINTGEDTQFTLVNSSHMIGNIKTFMRQDMESWAIIDRAGKVLSRAGTSFPLGLLPWVSEESEKKMLLHLYVEQPGHFCCDNGYCIDSQVQITTWNLPSPSLSSGATSSSTAWTTLMRSTASLS